MNNNKAFTLTELLAVIVILALIFSLITTSVIDIANRSKEDIKDTKISSIEIAASKYANESINDYQLCVGDSTALNNNGCVFDINDILPTLLEKKYLNFNELNEELNGQIVFCFDYDSISINATYYADSKTNYKCESNISSNYMQIFPSSSVAYANTKILLNVISFDLKNITYSSPSRDITINSANNELIEISVGNINFGSKSEIKYSIPFIGTFNDGEKTTFNYELTIKKIEFSMDDSLVLMETNSTVNLPVHCINCDKLVYKDSVLSSYAIKDDKLEIVSYSTTGSESLSITESNANIKKDLELHVFTLKSVGNEAFGLDIGEQQRIDFEAAGLDRIDVLVSDSSVLTVDKSGINSNYFNITAKKNTGEEGVKVTLVGYVKLANGSVVECKRIEYMILVGDFTIGLEKESAEMFVGGDTVSTGIKSNNNLLKLICESSDPSAATCRINNNNTLVVTSGNKANNYVTITVRDENNITSTQLILNVKNIELSLSEQNITLYYNGETHTSIISNSSNKAVECKSSDERVATCEIRNSMLVVTSKTDNTATATITVKVSNLASAILQVTVRHVDLYVTDLENKSIYNSSLSSGLVCRNINATGTDTVRVRGENLGNVSIGEYVNDVSWYLADAEVNSGSVYIYPRTGICAGLGDLCSNSPFKSGDDAKNLNTGISTFNIVESNANKKYDINYYIYSISFDGNRTVNKNSTSTITIYYSYTGTEVDDNDYVPIITVNDRLQIQSISNPTTDSGFRGEMGMFSADEVPNVNLVKKVTVTIKGIKEGEGKINVKGSLCGNESYSINVVGKATCPTITNYEGIYDGTQKSISVQSAAVNGTAYYSIDGGSYWTTVPSTSVVGEHDVKVKVQGSSLFYNSITCADASIKIKNSKVEFMAYDGTISGTNPLYVRYGSNAFLNGLYSSTTVNKSSVPKVEKAGYIFSGWYNNNFQTSRIIDGVGNIQANSVYTDSSSKWNITNNITLYSAFTPEKYTITYDANGGENAPENQTKTYGEPLNLRSETPNRTGYDFLGWSQNAEATSATYPAGGTYTSNGAITLYAVWKQSTYDGELVYLCPNGTYQTSSTCTVDSVTNIKTSNATCSLSSTCPSPWRQNYIGPYGDTCTPPDLTSWNESTCAAECASKGSVMKSLVDGMCSCERLKTKVYLETTTEDTNKNPTCPNGYSLGSATINGNCTLPSAGSSCTSDYSCDETYTYPCTATGTRKYRCNDGTYQDTKTCYAN